MSDEVPDEVETISLDEYNQYAQAEEEAFLQQLDQKVAAAPFARDLNDTVTALDHARTQYWSDKMLEACGAGAGERQYDEDGNPL